MSLFSADKESVPFCLYAAVSNTLSFLSCACSSVLPCGQEDLGRADPAFQSPKYSAGVGADQSSPAAPVRGTVNRAKLVPAVARGMKKAEHGRRKKDSG